MAKTEYWLYPTDFTETSCITSLEMLMSGVICLYYPVAGLVDTLGDYGIPIEKGQEINTILKLSEFYKQNMIKRGRIYAESCSWRNRSKQWSKLMGIGIDQSVHVINLPHRLDRREFMESRLKKLNLNFKFFDAIYGKELTDIPKIKKMFKGNDFNYRRGVIGCTLTHLELWKQLVNSNLDYLVILEDDVILCDDFENKLSQVCNLFVEQNIEHLALGRAYNCTLNSINNLFIQPKDPYVLWNITFAYIISRSAAKKALEYIKNVSIKAAFDCPYIFGNLIDYHCLNENIVAPDFKL
jgi:glycosyl transferase family 25